MARKSPPSKPEEAPPSFEERLEALEAVVEELEGEELPLERQVARYREGVAHLQACRALLDDAERRLVELVEAEDGEALERELDDAPDADA